MQRAQAKHAKILFQRHFVFNSRASISNLDYLRYFQNRTNSTFAESVGDNKNISEHSEYAHLSGGRRWEFRAGAMARLASGSVVLNTDEDNAILGTVVCKYTQKILNEEEIIKEIEENERLESSKNNEVEEEFEEDETKDKYQDEYGIGDESSTKSTKKNLNMRKSKMIRYYLL
uniref:Uncharacterized protein n=1 Tax=Meloidogyne hapla TaxID=6305 RepID=A0A1I8B3U6_MELHA